MRQTTRPTQQRQEAPDASPLNATALSAFASLDPNGQTMLLQMLARWAKVTPSRLLATEAQREAWRLYRAETRAEKAKEAAAQRQRVTIRQQLNALHNRAQRRRFGYMTPAELRRREALYRRLNELDKVV